MEDVPKTIVCHSDPVDSEQRNEQFIATTARLNQEIDAYLDGQQVTRESLDVVISV